MRQMIVGAVVGGLLVFGTGQASAELTGFLTNETVARWNSPDYGLSPRRAKRTKSSRVRKSRRRVRTAKRVRKWRSRRSTRSSRSSWSGRSLRGIASYYWQPQRVASGGWFNPNALTAAHKSLPFGTRVRVTHLGNGRSVVVRINDRGPYIRGRIIDLSKRAAGVIGMRKSGIARVRVDVLGRGRR